MNPFDNNATNDIINNISSKDVYEYTKVDGLIFITDDVIISDESYDHPPIISMIGST